MKQEGRGASCVSRLEPTEGRGCPKVTQPVCMGCLWPRTSRGESWQQGDPAGLGHGLGVGWSPALLREVLAAALVGLRTLSPPRGRAWPILSPVDVTGFLLSPSLPPSLCVSLPVLSLSHPLRIPSLAHPISVACACGFGGAPFFYLPSRLVLPAFSLSAPGGRYTAALAPRHQTRGGGWGSGSWALGWQTGLESVEPRTGGGPVPGPRCACPCLSVSSHAWLCPRPASPAFPVLALPLSPLPTLPEALSLC